MDQNPFFHYGCKASQATQPPGAAVEAQLGNPPIPPSLLAMHGLLWCSLLPALQTGSIGVSSASMDWSPSFPGLGSIFAGSPSQRPAQNKSQNTSKNTAVNDNTPGVGSGAEDAPNALDIMAEAQRQNAGFWQGVAIYAAADRLRDRVFDCTPESVWGQGASRLLYYHGAADTPHVSSRGKNRPILLVPSLINRADILDIHPARSVARWLQKQGYPVYMLEWGAPGDAEGAFSSSAYVEERLLPAIAEVVVRHSGEAVTLAGYCMGGMLALAAAQLAPKGQVGALVCMATPWDFKPVDAAGGADGDGDAQAARHGLPWLLQQPALREELRQIIAQHNGLPGWMLPPMFYHADPWLFQRKYARLAAIAPQSEGWELFIALEQWLHDSVSLTQAVAEECFIHWPAHNSPMYGQWQVGEHSISPASLSMPVCVIIPKKDKVVPASSSDGLYRALLQPHLIAPDTGHVGLVMSRRAAQDVWQPLVQWLEGVA